MHLLQMYRTKSRMQQEIRTLLKECERLREQLKEANDVIQYALEMSSDDDSTRVFEDYLEVIE
tara:strand:+ start:1234 stop:1422 length:189 start_codon:yes stop_codon:yes gene_type:complete